MGYGNYSSQAHDAIVQKRAKEPVQEVFQQTGCHPLMNPKGLRLREARDSAEHPNSLGIVFALDVTGSMGTIPKLMATQMLPKFMKILTDCHVKDPQLLFMAVGDATSDQAPLQVGQFESTAQLMDQWLTWSYLEGRGGGNNHESYELALYTLAQHTAMDCWEKRQKKGYVFLTGDELPFPSLSKHVVESLIGDRLDQDLTAEEIVAELQKTFVPFFVIPDQKRRENCEARWRELLGDHVLCMSNPQDICYVSAGAVCLYEGLVPDMDALGRVFKDMGLEYGDLSSVMRALTPLAEALGRTGGPAMTGGKSPEGVLGRIVQLFK
ncbi:VWA domain-containing protein [Archangium primigenium]|uniref:VWA domain-containing protein n=1 Tax=[Archangium] primigenium TaxID=2792470 RepID=UPI00195E5195|nr:VWA domain-containing protein [Archangium primigenium]MBM7113330.1 VWA domain-containing protein [Archangium primigenium]